MDLSKLTDEQLDIADKIAKKAKAKGLNPDFVLPLVMAESGFNPKAVSKKGAIGVMQLMPDTATGLRVDPHNLDENIEGGLNLLKELIANKKIGNDPYKVLAGYNTSTATRNKFLESGDLSVLPDETINYMDKVSTYFGGNLPTVTGEVVAEAAKPEPEAEPGDGNVVDDTIKPAPKGLPNETDPFAVAGGVTGASIASSVETGKRALPLIQGLYDRATGSTDQMYRPQSRASLQRYLNSQIADDLRIPLKDLEKVSGGKPVRTMSEVQDALANIKGAPSERVAKTASIDPKTGQPRKIYSTTPGKAPVDLSAYKHTPTLATRAVDQASKGTDIVKGALPSVGRIGLGAFGGAMAGVQGYDAYELAKKIERDKAEGRTRETVMGLTPDQWRLASKTAATAGGVASMFPLGITQVVGGIAQAPELALSVYDYLNKPKEAQTPKGGLSAP